MLTHCMQATHPACKLRKTMLMAGNASRHSACLQCTQNCYRTHGNGKFDGSYFFKVMVNDFATRLRVPPKFVDQMNDIIGPDVILEGPSGQLWHAELCCMDTKVTIVDGWERFVSDHAIEIGDFLVFQHAGKSHFIVQIFERSGCLKYCPFKVTSFEELYLQTEKMCMISDPKMQENGMIHTPNFHENKYLIGVSDKMTEDIIEISDTNSCDVSIACDKPVDKMHGGCYARKTNVIETSDTNACDLSIAYGKPVDKMHSSSHARKRLDKMHSSSCARKRNVIEISDINSRDASIAWGKPIDETHNSHAIKIKSDAGPSLENVKIGLPWPGSMNILQTDTADKCVKALNYAQLPSNKKVKYIKSQRKGSKCYASQHSYKLAGNEGVLKEALSFKTRKPACMLIMHKSAVSSGHRINFPLKFSQRWLPKDGIGITLLGPDKKDWRSKYPGWRSKCYLSGWKCFVLAYKLKRGDICLFELVDKKTFTFDVHIFWARDYIQKTIQGTPALPR